MGCDIHIVLERREKGSSEWVGLWASDWMPNGRPLIAQRDYGFFAEVAQVRGEGTGARIFPRNLPKDVSRLAWLMFMRAPTDYHSTSHMTVPEFTAAWFRASDGRSWIRGQQPRPEFAASDLLGVWDDENESDYRVVFWFDN